MKALESFCRLKFFLRWLKLSVGKDDLVLDVGSGNNPAFWSDVLCDKFVADNTERGGRMVVDGRSLVVGDIEDLPFLDGAFDYVIACHVIEHVHDAPKALTELSRVAGAGYIEAPSEFFERIAGHPFHKWMVRLVGDTGAKSQDIAI